MQCSFSFIFTNLNYVLISKTLKLRLNMFRTIVHFRTNDLFCSTYALKACTFKQNENNQIIVLYFDMFFFITFLLSTLEDGLQFRQ